MTLLKTKEIEEDYYNRMAHRIFSLGFAIGTGKEQDIRKATLDYLVLENELERHMDVLPFRKTVESGLKLITHDEPGRYSFRYSDDYLRFLEREIAEGRSE